MDDVELLKGGLKGEHSSPAGVGRPQGRLRRRAGKAGTDARIRELLCDHPRGLTVDGVGRALSIGRSTAARRLDALARAGELEAETYGQTRVFTLPRRAAPASVLRKPAPLVLILSPDLRVTGANEPLLSLFHLDRKELVGRRITRSPLARHLGEHVPGEVLKGSEGVAVIPEFECLVGDARYILQGRATPLAGPRGPAGVIVILEDVTGMALHRRKIEEVTDGGTSSLLASNPLILGEILRRREEEARLRLVEASVDQAGVAAIWTGRDGRVLRANPAAAAALGYGVEELARLEYSDLDLDHPPGSWEDLWDALKGGQVTRYPGRFRTRDGGTLRMEVQAGHVAHGGLECSLFLAMEATRPGGAGDDPGAIAAAELPGREREEAALRQANERLHLLTAVTRHDALNDLSALGMYLGIMDDELGDRPGLSVPPSRLMPLVESLRRRMEFTLDYAGLGARAPGWEEVAGAVGRAVAGPEAGRLRVDLDLPALEVYADPLFERAVANLVDNTLRHGEHATCIRFLARIEGNDCILTVEDDGAGIPAGIKEAVFRPGFGRHTGLGLSLVREILSITGMSIRETGDPGMGARFEIRVPAGGFRVREEGASPAAGAPAPGGRHPVPEEADHDH
jgi:PAS domain S-box-containing protein